MSYRRQECTQQPDDDIGEGKGPVDGRILTDIQPYHNCSYRGDKRLGDKAADGVYSALHRIYEEGQQHPYYHGKGHHLKRDGYGLC